jgi:hypothetical protein
MAIKNLELSSKHFRNENFDVVLPLVPYSAVMYNDKLIVGYDYDELKLYDAKLEFWRAVFCYDKFGKMLWQVEPPYYIDKYSGEKRWPKFVDSDGHCLEAITSVKYKEEQDILIAYGTMGYRLDPETGKLGEIVYKER